MVVTKEANQCHHFWEIESANGPISRGKCKYCGVVKEFRNSWHFDKPIAASNLGEAPRLVNTKAQYY